MSEITEESTITTTESLIEETPKEPTTQPIQELKIESWQDLFNAMCIIRGVDPNQVQSMAKFSNFDNSDERSYYPNQFTVVAIAQLRMTGDSLYKGHSWNEYELMAEYFSIGFMGYKGFKSEQYKDITSGQVNLEKLQGLPDDIKKGVLSGIFGGKKE